MLNYYLLPIDLAMFAGDLNPNTTTSEGLTEGVKTYYSNYLIDLAEPELIHDQFGLKQTVPQHGGKSVEFRQFAALPEMTTPLQEGITPNGQNLSMETITANAEQYGGYVTLSDMLIMTDIDPMIVQATKAISSQAGRSLDTVSREALNAGTFVMYGGAVDDRSELYYTSADDNCNLKAADIKRVVREMETANVPKINGWYVAIIHPYAKFDLTNDPAWKNPHEYSDTAEIYNGEIGELYGVRTSISSPPTSLKTP